MNILADLETFLRSLALRIDGFDELGDTSLATDEFGETIDVSEDPFIPEILTSAAFFNPFDGDKDFFCLDGPDGQCHSICCNFLLKNDSLDHGYRLFTGFALHKMSDEWFTHSFIINNDCAIVEPTSTQHRLYVGIELSGEKLKNFIKNHA